MNPGGGEAGKHNPFSIRADVGLYGRDIPEIELTKDFRYTNVNFESEPANLGELLPKDNGNFLVNVVERRGKVRSTNPGQLYGVINITSSSPISNVTVTDNFGDQFDVNPAKLNGGVHVMIVDGTGNAMVITNSPGVTGNVDNDANTVTLDIDLIEALGSPMEPGNSLMIYIKFKNSMKGQPFSNFTDEFLNEASIEINEEIIVEVEATILLTTK
jgi:hypothetical protein